ncbi:FAD-dependent oxidoreductase [Candidatus Saccharibacteria bacterium]|nr:FAD-dependent oxidoreductase [Candidatus Saccharibacteria bacterium]
MITYLKEAKRKNVILSKRKIVIIGGGFGGVKAALELAKDSNFDITLISANSDFRIYSTLYRVATGGSMKLASVPLEEIFTNRNVKLVIDTAKELNRENTTIKTGNGQIFTYHALVCALGVTTNYFGIKGLEEFSYGIKSPEEANALKDHLHKQLITDGKTDISYVVVGGGPTGVELAGALPDYVKKICKHHGLPKRKIHVDLVESSSRILPRMPKDISFRVKHHLKKSGVHVMTNKTVQAQTADALMVNNKPIRSHTVVWTAGVTNNPFFTDHNFQLAANRKVRVDQFLQAEPGIYVIGDNADTPYSGMAQVAIEDGKFVAENLKRITKGEAPLPYIAKKPIYVMPAGPRWAAVLWGKVRIHGILGWWLRRAADFMAYRDYEPWHMAIRRWMAEDEEEESCSICNDKLSRVLYESGSV